MKGIKLVKTFWGWGDCLTERLGGGKNAIPSGGARLFAQNPRFLYTCGTFNLIVTKGSFFDCESAKPGTAGVLDPGALEWPRADKPVTV